MLSFHDKYGNRQIRRSQQGYLFWFSKVDEAIIISGHEKNNFR